MRTTVILLALFGVIFSGCASYRPGAASTPARNWKSGTEYDLGIIELDDQGWLHDRPDAARVLDEISKAAQRGPTNIVVFVHGWHHNAEERDCNLESFRRSLARLNDELDMPLYREARRMLFGNPASHVVGLYVGWRGRSLPMPLDYATFWDRKRAAFRVGHGDLPEVLTRLESIYRKGNANPKSYTGLVTVGHSFGGQVVFAAVTELLKTRLATAVPLTKEPASGVLPRIDSFGDLVVLVNPALESSVFNSIDVLTRRGRYDAMQAPVLMVISSEGDFPNRRLFPIGRGLSVVNEPLGSSAQFRQKITAMGWYEPHLTHCLALDGGPGCKDAAAQVVLFDATKYQQPEPDQASKSHCRDADRIRFDEDASKRNAGAWTMADLLQPSLIRLAGEYAFAGTRLYRTDPAIDVNNPFMMVKATRQISNDHNDMFNPNLVNFLIRFTAGTQLKRISTRFER